MKVVYEATYATRGKTGIPRDARNLITIFNNLNLDSLTVIFFLKDTILGLFRKKNVEYKRSLLIGSAFRPDVSSRSLIPTQLRALLLGRESMRFNHNVRMIELSASEKQSVLESLEISKIGANSETIKLALINYRSRLARPRLLTTFKLKSVNADIFVQQQVDPIKVDSRVAHVLRLHDILPITHPQFFDSLSVRNFNKSFHKMIKSKPFIVMDSPSCAIELETKFGLKGKVFVVPPVVTFSTKPIMN